MTLPNCITLLRIFLVPFFYTALAYYQPGRDEYRWMAFAIFLIASLTDALDGFIVRKWSLRSELGTFLDPLADKLLLISAFLGVNVSSLALKPPLWIVIIVIFRDIFIVCGLIVVFITTRNLFVRPNFLGKITTFLQMTTILLILLQVRIAAVLWYLTAGLTIVSGVVYILREMRRLNHAKPTNITTS